ncbi:MAG TPA: aconitate hydratase AcnA [Longimicrobiales bacterium]|nr:aconitate hydratase AcnA [Longimicrobiales bacterium]
MANQDSFGSRAQLTVGGRSFEIFRLDALEQRGLDISRLPFSLRILLENMLRHETGVDDTKDDIEALTKWDAQALPSREINFTPARVLLQDFTGVPAVVDLAAMRDAMKRMGGDPTKINPLQPAELVIDHSVQVDEFGTRFAFQHNVEREYERNQERYAFLRWGQTALRNFRVVPPGTGIVHQVNLEYLARVVFHTDGESARPQAYPDTLVGTDSHTTMVNGLGVLGWGVGGIEAEAAMLGQPVSMLIPQVVGFKLTGEMPEGATATDLVLTVTERLRARGVVGKFVEFFGPGLASLRLADRATIGNMAPEYGATCGIFPVDELTLSYLKFTGRRPEHVELVRAYMKEQGLFHTQDTPEPDFSDVLELDLGTVEPSLAGPRRPQDRIPLTRVKTSFFESLEQMRPTLAPAAPAAPAEGGIEKWERNGGSTKVAVAVPLRSAKCRVDGSDIELCDGAVVIAAITSCTNTSNPSVMLGAGLVAKKAVELGLTRKPWVKTSLAPGSKVVTDYLDHAGLTPYLEQLGFSLVGYGCTTCIGNSGPLPEVISNTIHDGELVVASVLSGNRNFEGRINPDVRANYLASPPLVVAYAIAGRMDYDPYNEPIGTGKDGRSVFLRDIWPTQQEIDDAVQQSVQPEMFERQYAHVFEGDAQWRALPSPESELYQWEDASTYVKNPPYFVDMPATPGAISDIAAARVLVLVGDSITTDHISPAGSIKVDSPAGRYLIEHGVVSKDFNSYGARRGNHEVMMRGTFANIRLRNRLNPDVEGGMTTYLPDGAVLSIFDAAVKYQQAAVPLIVIAGKEYGSGSSRDWAAKGPLLLGVRAVIAESYERIHRSNLIGMGILPLQFREGDSYASLGLTGRETYDITDLVAALDAGAVEQRVVRVVATDDDGRRIEFNALARLDTPQEREYYRHGGILQFVLRQLMQA